MERGNCVFHTLACGAYLGAIFWTRNLYRIIYLKKIFLGNDNLQRETCANESHSLCFKPCKPRLARLLLRFRECANRTPDWLPMHSTAPASCFAQEMKLPVAWTQHPEAGGVGTQTSAKTPAPAFACSCLPAAASACSCLCLKQMHSLVSNRTYLQEFHSSTHWSSRTDTSLCLQLDLNWSDSPNFQQIHSLHTEHTEKSLLILSNLIKMPSHTYCFMSW